MPRLSRKAFCEMDEAKIAHHLDSCFCNICAFAKLLGIADAVVGFIRLCKPGKFFWRAGSNQNFRYLQLPRRRPPHGHPGIWLSEWVTISAPNSNGRRLMGVGKVLSTIRGTPWRCAALANFSISNTAREGLESVSPKTHLVFS